MAESEARCGLERALLSIMRDGDSSNEAVTYNTETSSDRHQTTGRRRSALCLGDKRKGGPKAIYFLRRILPSPSVSRLFSRELFAVCARHNMFAFTLNAKVVRRHGALSKDKPFTHQNLMSRKNESILAYACCFARIENSSIFWVKMSGSCSLSRSPYCDCTTLFLVNSPLPSIIVPKGFRPLFMAELNTISLYIYRTRRSRPGISDRVAQGSIKTVSWARCCTRTAPSRKRERERERE